MSTSVMMTATSKPPVSVSQAQYEALAGGPPVLPTQRELFDYKLGRLKDGDFNVEEMLPLAEFIPEHGLFLLVPRRPEPLDYGRLMGRVMLNGRTGVNYLDQKYLKDEVEVPQGPYIMLGVEDGRSRLNTRPMDSHANILKEGRSPYLAFEGIVHAAVFPSVLLHHYMDCVGSRYDEQCVPSVCVDDEEPALDNGFGDGADPKWGAPSCGSRKGLL
jgi:Family of unknown function (DUF5701)